MKRKQGPILTAVLVDYDNIYLALRRKSEDAAKKFAKDAGLWLKDIESGGLISPTNSLFSNGPRRIVLNRCYGNPVPRRNTHDNSTDMNSFPFVRHHFLRAGFEVIDCPPLTAQLKNSSDIRMVMDVRDLLMHDTYFDEFIIMSGDADFTPVLHRLRAHARRTVIYANDHTAVPYTAICDGEVRESELIGLLTDGGRITAAPVTAAPAVAVAAAAPMLQIKDMRQAILSQALDAVRASSHPIAVDILAERVVHMLGHDNTVGTGWAGAGSLHQLLIQSQPPGIRVGGQEPYFVFDVKRQLAEQVRRPEVKAPPAESPAPQAPAAKPAAPAAAAAPAVAARMAIAAAAAAPAAKPAMRPAPSVAAMAPPAAAAPQRAARAALPPLAAPPIPQEAIAARQQRPAPTAQPPPHAESPAAYQQPVQAPIRQHVQQHVQLQVRAPNQVRAPQQTAKPAPAAAPPPSAAARETEVTSAMVLQQSLARILEASQAPPLLPPNYRVLFDIIAREIVKKGLAGSQTLTNIMQRAQELDVDVRFDEVRFVLDVISETDPWLDEMAASASLYAGRFRNFVVARCRSQGLNLSVEELDLIEAWFVAGAQQQATHGNMQGAARQPVQAPVQAGGLPARALPAGIPPPDAYRTQDMPAAPSYAESGYAEPGAPQQPGLAGGADEEFPRIVRTRLRG